MSLAWSGHLLLIHVGSPEICLRGRLSSRTCSRVALTWTWALGRLSARAGRLGTTSSCREHSPDVFWHEGRSWLLEHLLKLLVGVVEPVLEASDLWLLVRRALKVLHRQIRELLGVQELCEVCEDQVDVLSRVRGLAGAPQQECLLKEVE